VTFTYNGSSTAPTVAGSYTVVGTISDANYQGSATGTLVITQALATVTLSNLMQTYNGSPEAASVSTQPTGLVVVPSYMGISVSYGPTATPPTNPGTYTVTASVVDPNYTGFATNTLTINQLSPALSLALLTGMPEPSPYGTMVYFELSMATTPCPTGQVQFNVDGNLASTVTLTGTSCTLPVQYRRPR
jgi:glucose dehydrogenase